VELFREVDTEALEAVRNIKSAINSNNGIIRKAFISKGFISLCFVTGSALLGATLLCVYCIVENETFSSGPVWAKVITWTLIAFAFAYGGIRKMVLIENTIRKEDMRLSLRQLMTLPVFEKIYFDSYITLATVMAMTFFLARAFSAWYLFLPMTLLYLGIEGSRYADVLLLKDYRLISFFLYAQAIAFCAFFRGNIMVWCLASATFSLYMMGVVLQLGKVK